MENRVITGEIVDYKIVVKDDLSSPKTEPARQITSEDIESLREKLGITSLKRPTRPQVVTGYTLRLKYNSYGSVYITLNYDAITNKLIEVFVTSSKTSPKHQAYANVIARMVSNQIKFGITLDQIYKHLLGIDEGDSVFVRYPGQEKSTLVRSMPDLIGNALRLYPTYSHLEGIVWDEDEEDATHELDAEMVQKILYGEKAEVAPKVDVAPQVLEEGTGCAFGNTPDCPDAVWKREAGCDTCLTCGFSKCG